MDCLASIKLSSSSSKLDDRSNKLKLHRPYITSAIYFVAGSEKKPHTQTVQTKADKIHSNEHGSLLL